MSANNDTDDARIDPAIMFNLKTDSEQLEALPDGTTITIRGPDGQLLTEVDTADNMAVAFEREGMLVDCAGNRERSRAYFIRAQNEVIRDENSE